MKSQLQSVIKICWVWTSMPGHLYPPLAWISTAGHGYYLFPKSTSGGGYPQPGVDMQAGGWISEHGRGYYKKNNVHAQAWTSTPRLVAIFSCTIPSTTNYILRAKTRGGASGQNYIAGFLLSYITTIQLDQAPGVAESGFDIN